MRKLYLDIDGVILTHKNVKAADGAIELIDYIHSNYDCYWLTTHCHNGNADGALKMLSYFFPAKTIEKLKNIKPVRWNTLKTEGIDFESDFYWLDDYAFESEKKVLIKHNCIQNLILVDLNNKNELLQIIENKLSIVQTA